MGLFISFEGIDKCGKATQIALLEKRLKEHSIPYELGREPGGTNYGEAARRLAQDPHFIERLNSVYDNKLDLKTDLDPAGELFAFLIARSMFAKHVVLPALQKGKLFIADRCGDSSVAFQGYGNFRGDPEVITLIKQANQFVMQSAQIERTYLLDITEEESANRQGTAEFGTKLDRIEQRNKQYFERVRKGYLELAKEEPERFKIIDGTKTPAEIHEIIWQDLQQLLKKGQKILSRS